MTADSRISVKGPADRPAAIYDRYAIGLYQQAFFALGDAGLAEQVLCEVIAAECARPQESGSGPTGGQRLARAVYRRCRDLAAGQAAPQQPARRRAGTGSREPRGPLTSPEHDALGLVVFGKLDYQQVGEEMGMSREAVADLLQGALRKLAASQ